MRVSSGKAWGGRNPTATAAARGGRRWRAGVPGGPRVQREVEEDEGVEADRMRPLSGDDDDGGEQQELGHGDGVGRARRSRERSGEWRRRPREMALGGILIPSSTCPVAVAAGDGAPSSRPR